MKMWLYVFWLLFSVCIHAEKINFEIYKVNANGNKSLIVSGSREYNASDFIINPEFRHGTFYGTRKRLVLAKGYTIGYLDTYETPLRGFGLTIGRVSPFIDRHDFSWEWFEKSGSDLFKKLQGGNMVKVKTHRVTMTQEELESIVFKEDVQMEYQDNTCKSLMPGEFSHIIVIKAGSALKFPSVKPYQE